MSILATATGATGATGLTGATGATGISQSLIQTPVTGLEDIQRATFYMFFSKMNGMLQQISDYWTPRDLRFDEVTGRSTSPTVLESIPNANFHEGHKPSLINGAPENYPNLAVFAMRADPNEEDGPFDQIDSWSDQILVEIMVKGEDEDLVNRRIQRTTEAAVACLREYPTLGGAVLGPESSPVVTISDVFALKADPSNGGYGERLIWQGSAIEWIIQKKSTQPQSPIFSQSSQTDYSKYIDQG